MKYQTIADFFNDKSLDDPVIEAQVNKEILAIKIRTYLEAKYPAIAGKIVRFVDVDFHDRTGEAKTNLVFFTIETKEGKTDYRLFFSQTTNEPVGKIRRMVY